MDPKLNSLELEILRDITNGKLINADYHQTKDDNGEAIPAEIYNSLEKRGYIKLATLKEPYAGMGDKEIAGITRKGLEAINTK